VVVNYAGRAAPAQTLVADIRLREEVHRCASRCGDCADVERLFKESMEAFGKPECGGSLCGHHAAVSDCRGDVLPSTRLIATNLRRNVLVFAHAAQHVQDGGRIMAFSAAFWQSPSRLTVPTSLPRRESKGLVHVLATNCVAETHGQCGGAGPGANGAVPKGKSEARIDELKKMNPLERLGLPEDMANLVSFLAGPEGGWITAGVACQRRLCVLIATLLKRRKGEAAVKIRNRGHGSFQRIRCVDGASSS